MTALATMRQLLEAQLADHQKKPTSFYKYSERLRGAAELAKSVALEHGDEGLTIIAERVLLWLDDREDALEEESHLEHERIWERYQGRQNVRKAAARAVKAYIGMEVIEPQWDVLVKAYQFAFPTFQIRNSVSERLHPKKHSASIRNHLCNFIDAQRLGREPLLSEIQALHPQALIAHREETLKYLERSLPGFDFHAAWAEADLKEKWECYEY